MKSRLLAVVAVTLVLAEVLLCLASWLLSAMMVDGVHSMLSGEALRWFTGHFASMLQSPLLVWLLVWAMAGGCLVKSGLPQLFTTPTNYRQRVALRATALLLVLYVGVLLLLTALPHAVLLSATGHLWPSSFSRALVPLLALGVLLLSVCYGSLSRTFTAVHQVTDAMVYGLARSAPLLMLYVLAMQFYQSLRFVFFA